MIAALLLASAGPAGLGEQPQVGDIFEDKHGAKFRSWHHLGGGLGVDDQPYAVFARDGAKMIAATSAVVTGPRGGIEVEKILATRIVKALPGEEEIDGSDCTFLTLWPVLAFYDSKTRIARGFFAVDKQIIEKRWIAAPDECQYSGD